MIVLFCFFEKNKIIAVILQHSKILPQKKEPICRLLFLQTKLSLIVSCSTLLSKSLVYIVLHAEIMSLLATLHLKWGAQRALWLQNAMDTLGKSLD